MGIPQMVRWLGGTDPLRFGRMVHTVKDLKSHGRMSSLEISVQIVGHTLAPPVCLYLVPRIPPAPDSGTPEEVGGAGQCFFPQLILSLNRLLHDKNQWNSEQLGWFS